MKKSLEDSEKTNKMRRVPITLNRGIFCTLGVPEKEWLRDLEPGIDYDNKKKSQNGHSSAENEASFKYS